MRGLEVAVNYLSARTTDFYYYYYLQEPIVRNITIIFIIINYHRNDFGQCVLRERDRQRY